MIGDDELERVRFGPVGKDSSLRGVGVLMYVVFKFFHRRNELSRNGRRQSCNVPTRPLRSHEEAGQLAIAVRTSAPTTSSGPRRRKRHVRCVTLIVRLEPSPVLPGAASQRARHTPRGHPIYRIGRILYVHRLSPTAGRGTTALNCPLKRGKSTIPVLRCSCRAC